MVDIFTLARDVGAILSLVISAGVVLSVAYSFVRGVPRSVRKRLGVDDNDRRLEAVESKAASVDELERRMDNVEMKVSTLVESMRMSQQLQLQQAKEFNTLSSLLFDSIDADGEKRPFLSQSKIRRILLEDDTPDFTEDEEDE